MNAVLRIIVQTYAKCEKVLISGAVRIIFSDSFWLKYLRINVICLAQDEYPSEPLYIGCGEYVCVDGVNTCMCVCVYVVCVCVSNCMHVYLCMYVF